MNTSPTAENSTQSHLNSPHTASPLAMPVWLGGAFVAFGIGAGAAVMGAGRGMLFPAGAALLGALLCAFAAMRSAHFPTRRLGWIIVAASLLLRAGGELLSAKPSLVGAILLFLQPLLLIFGLLCIARSAIVPQAAQPGEEPQQNEAPPFDWALAPDALVIGGSFAALLWWLLVEPMLLGAPRAANVRNALVANHAALHHLIALGYLTVLALLIAGRNELRPVLRDAQGDEGTPAPGWNIGWALLAIGTALFAAASYRFFWLRGAAPTQIDLFLRSAAPLLLGIAALGESFQLAGRWPGVAGSPLDARAARAFWLRNFAPLLFAGLAVMVAFWHFTRVGKATPLPGAWGEMWWGVFLIAIALVRHAFDSLLITRQTFEDYRSWNDLASSLQHDVAARTRELSTMHEVAADLSNTLDSSRILNTALERVMNTLGADAGALWLFRGDEEAPAAPLPLSGSADGPDTAGDEKGKADRRSGARVAQNAAPGRTPAAGRTNSASIRKALVESALAQMMGAHRAEWIPQGKRWHIVSSTQDEMVETRLDLQRNALRALHDGLEQGDLENALIVCRSLGNSFQGAHIVAIQWKGEILGAMAIVRHKGALSNAEIALVQSLALEVGSALQNAHLYQEAVRLADRDSLTDLLNHRAVQQQLNVTLTRTARSRDQFVILMLDVNNFKFFNDTYGHEAGDEVLKRVAEVMRQSCRISDVLGRYGGDEFIAVLLDTDTEGARVVVNRIEQKILDQAIESSDGRKIPIGLSFGAAIFPHDGEAALELLGVAGTNVTEAKHQGGGFVVRRHAEESAELKALKDASVGGSFGVLDALVTAIDNKDNYTRHHSEDVARWAVMIARQLGFSQEQQRSIRMCGLLHDVGKIAVPDSILRKPGRLSDEEFKIMQAHPVFGALIVKDVPDLDEVLGGIRHHHERPDGRGYPDKLKGEEIPLFGRILAVPDCFSAMTTNRPYRKGLSWEEALSEIEKGKGTQFDPVMADAFMEGIRELQAEEQANSAATAQAALEGNAPTSTSADRAIAEAVLQSADGTQEEDLGEGGYFMNIKPRSVMDAEAETAGQTQ